MEERGCHRYHGQITSTLLEVSMYLARNRQKYVLNEFVGSVCFMFHI